MLINLQNDMDLNQSVLYLLSKFVDSSLNGWQNIAWVDKLLIDGQTDTDTNMVRQTQVTDNNRRANLASGKNEPRNGKNDGIIKWSSTELVPDLRKLNVVCILVRESANAAGPPYSLDEDNSTKPFSLHWIKIFSQQSAEIIVFLEHLWTVFNNIN